ncbi:MAG: hypothetical protein HY735_05220 [Verrucomicrobia bacterium]|nr:hypothetical protein [Verrucomicrobiota bacterium]
MNLIHQLLNLAALLLWLAWRSAGILPRFDSPILSLASALKRATPHRTPRVFYLLALFAVLSIRSVVYWHLGEGAHWTPDVDLVALSLPFRSDHLWLMVIFSFLSFGLTVGLFYSWLLLISAANRGVSDSEPLQKLLRMHLGWLERWPPALKLFLPVLGSVVAWPLFSPALVKIGIIPSPLSRAHLWQQTAMLGLASLLVWKIFLVVLFLLHVVNSYVYFGDAALLNFASLTSQNILRCVRRLPLKAGRIDFTPIVAVAFVLIAATLAAHWLPRVFQRLPL